LIVSYTIPPQHFIFTSSCCPSLAAGIPVLVKSEPPTQKKINNFVTLSKVFQYIKKNNMEDILRRASEDLKFDDSKILLLKNNINIALFMDYEIATDLYQMEWVGIKDEERLERSKKNNFNYIPILFKEKSEPLFIDSFEYSTSWRHLMKVVEKIEQLNYMTEIVSISQNSHKMFIRSGGIFFLESHSFDTKIEAVYKACVDFVDEYNEINL
jgi:hypothetical protein